MVDKRNRVIELINYIQSCGVVVNVGKNHARGNRGFFRACENSFRIDVAKNLAEEAVLKTLAHEFAHFVHYKYDKSLKSLDFIFKNIEDYEEELISVTVAMLSKEEAKQMFTIRDSIKNEIVNLKKTLANSKLDFKSIEESIKRSELKYLLKHDNVKVVDFFKVKYYSVKDLKGDALEETYIKLLSKKRALKRINSKINKLNKYYNQPTELFARSFELYATNKDVLKKHAPSILSCYENIIIEKEIPLLVGFVNKIL